MPYDESKDLVLKAWEMEDLQFGVRKYGDEGTKKFQIGPRVMSRPGREPITVKAGRLDAKEVNFLASILPEVIKMMVEKGKKK